MSSRTVKQLRDLEIDEVSLVDKPANQHGLVAITKRDEGTMDELFDEHGRPIDEDSLQPGDVAFTADGERLVMLTDDDVQDLLDQGYEVSDVVSAEDNADDEHYQESGNPDRELVGVGKSRLAQGALGWAHRAANNKRGAAGLAAITGGASTVSYVGGRSRGRKQTLGTSDGGAFNGGKRYTPSLGREVASELSKALNDDDRDQVISKVAAHVDRLASVAETAVHKAAALEEFIEEQGWIEAAQDYDVPVAAEELGGILKAASGVLNERQMGALDRILKSAGEPVYYDETGVAGYSAESEIMDQVNATVRELVGKSGGDFTPEQATTALFAANPAAYDAYLSEKGA